MKKITIKKKKLKKYGDGGKPSFEDYYKTLPKEKSDTSNYNLRAAYNTFPYPEMQEFAQNPDKHLTTVGLNKQTGNYDFFKSKDHPTLYKELDWYNSNTPESNEFRNQYDLDKSGKYYKYVPKQPVEQRQFPGQSIQTPQYKTGGRIRRFGGGGENKPIEISDYNEYLMRNQAYQDSSDISNDSRRRISLASSAINPLIQQENKNKHFWQPTLPRVDRNINITLGEGYLVPNNGEAANFDSFLTPEHGRLFSIANREDPEFIRYMGNNPVTDAQNSSDLMGGRARSIQIAQYPRPVQPYHYQAQSTSSSVPQKPGFTWTYHDGFVPIRQKLDLPTMQSKGYESQNIPLQEPQRINPNYFSRPAQDVEQGNTQYFDKKTGKQILQPVKEFGGNIQTSSEKWEILPEAGDGYLIKDPRYDQKPLANSNSQIEQNIQKQGDIKQTQQNIDPRSKGSDNTTIREPVHEGMWNKTWNALEHPIQTINPKEGGQPMDWALGLPGQTIGAIGRTAKNIIDPQTYTDAPKAISSGVINLAGEQAPKEWNSAGLRTLTRGLDAAVAIPLASELKPLAGNLLREQIYKGIDPVGYGAANKIMDFPIQWTKNTFAKDETDRALRVGLNLSGITTENSGDELLRMGQNRLDAFRVGLKLPQKYNTFGKNPDGSYNIRRMNPSVDHLASVYTDKMASDIGKMSVYSGDNPLEALTENYRKVTSPKINYQDPVWGTKDYSLYDLERSMGLRKSKAWEQQRIVEPSKNPGFSHSVYDNDPNGIMGQFRWDVKREPYGDIHFQSNDTWNLNPFEKRGSSLIADKSDILHKHYFKPLQNLEALKLVGGEPFDIKNNFIVDPKTYEIKKTFENGGNVNWEIVDDNEWSIVE